MMTTTKTNEPDSTTRTNTKPVQELVLHNFSLDNKIRQACDDLKPNVQWLLMELPRERDRDMANLIVGSFID